MHSRSMWFTRLGTVRVNLNCGSHHYCCLDFDRTKHKKGLSVCGLAWNPKKNGEIAFTDIMGQVGVFEGVIPSNPANQVNQVA